MVLIDWQFAGWDNPLMDVTFLLYSSVCPELRRQHETELLSFYYKELGTMVSQQKEEDFKFAEEYSFDRCLEDFHSAKLSVFVQTIASFDAFVVDDDDDENAVSTTKEENNKHGQAHPSEKQSRLLARLTSMVRDLVQDGVL